MHWVMTAFMACSGIQVVEYLNRTMGHTGWARVLLWTCVPIVFSQWSLWMTWKNAPSLMMAWIYFTVINSIMRLGTSYMAGETPNLYTYAGVALALGAAGLIKYGSTQ